MSSYCCLPCFLLWDRECSRLVLEGFKREQTGDPGKKKSVQNKAPLVDTGSGAQIRRLVGTLIS